MAIRGTAVKLIYIRRQISSLNPPDRLSSDSCRTLLFPIDTRPEYDTRKRVLRAG